MVNKLINIDLPEEVWKIVDNEFKLNKESNAEVLCNIIRNYIAEHGLYPDIHSLAHGHGIKDYIDIHQAMINSIIEILENKKVATYQEWAKIMEQKVMKE
jgi:L-rhamnose mutarotase